MKNTYWLLIGILVSVLGIAIVGLNIFQTWNLALVFTITNLLTVPIFLTGLLLNGGSWDSNRKSVDEKQNLTINEERSY